MLHDFIMVSFYVRLTKSCVFIPKTSARLKVFTIIIHHECLSQHTGRIDPILMLSTHSFVGVRRNAKRCFQTGPVFVHAERKVSVALVH